MKRTLALTTLLLLAGLPIVSHAQWNTPQIVDDSGNPGKYTSLAHDSNGTPHIAYAGSGSGVYHAVSDGLGGWSIEAVYTSTYVGYVRMLIDENDVVHIAWHRAYSYNDLYWAYKDAGGSWVQSTINGGTNGHHSFAMGEDGLGNPSPHFVGYHGNNLAHFYYDTVSESWTSEIIDGAGNVGQYTSMAIDSMGRMYVSYYDVGGYNLKFAYHNGTDWTTFLVDGLTENVGKYTSLVLDASGVPHVTYYDETSGELKHATINLGS